MGKFTLCQHVICIFIHLFSNYFLSTYEFSALGMLCGCKNQSMSGFIIYSTICLLVGSLGFDEKQTHLNKISYGRDLLG